jgi:hypothetical protein
MTDLPDTPPSTFLLTFKESDVPPTFPITLKRRDVLRAFDLLMENRKTFLESFQIPEAFLIPINWPGGMFSATYKRRKYSMPYIKNKKHTHHINT